VMFQSKRYRPGFTCWETQAPGQLEVALLTEIIGAKPHPKYVFTYVARGRKGSKGGIGQDAVFEGDGCANTPTFYLDEIERRVLAGLETQLKDPRGSSGSSRHTPKSGSVLLPPKKPSDTARKPGWAR
jgi:hypothetical protein